MIKNIIFDLGGVIIRLNDISVPVERFKALGIKGVDENLNIYGQSGVFRGLESGEITEEEFLCQVSELAGRRITAEEAEYAWLGFLNYLPPENLQHLRTLRERGYRLFLLSNTNGYVQRYVESGAFSPEGKAIGDFFDGLFYSHVMRDYKPSASIFQRVLKEAGLKAEECIFLDDALHNVEGAEAQGIRGLHVPKNGDWMPLLEECLKD